MPVTEGQDFSKNYRLVRGVVYSSAGQFLGSFSFYMFTLRKFLGCCSSNKSREGPIHNDQSDIGPIS